MTLLPIVEDESITYPESDGEPLGENTLQIDWIIAIRNNLDDLFRDDPNVCVFADLFWYPVRGQPGIRTAPDVMVVFGRPRGPRRSYLHWREDNVAPQVVFEVQSPGNSAAELQRRFDFFQQYGAEEYYLWYPDEGTLAGWLRSGDQLIPVAYMDGHVSPRLRIRFRLVDGELTLYRPNGDPFQTFTEVNLLREQAEQAREQAERERKQAEQAREQAERERKQAEQAREQAEQAREQAERERKQAEQAREQAEQGREQAEQGREQAEQGREQAEQGREQAEQGRKQAERARDQAERERDQAERAREQAERASDQAAADARLAREAADRLAAQLRAMGIDPESGPPPQN